jgi:DNA-binding response OmpR family regulator
MQDAVFGALEVQLLGQASNRDEINFSMRILLIEDDPMVGEGLARALHNSGMSVDWVVNGFDGEEALTNGGHALVLLDLGIPGKSGMELLAQQRTSGNRIPIIVLTARDAVDNRVTGLDLGADDYVLKPFAVRELIARINAVMRRQGGAARPLLETAEIRLDLANHEVTYRDTTVMLPAREFALLRALMGHPDSILSRAQLEERLYGWGEEVESNAIDVLIHSVRKKLGKDIIRNVRGAGWMVPK